MAEFSFDEFLRTRRDAVERALEARLPDPGDGADGQAQLLRSMRHAVLGGGKRLRPIVALAAAEAVGGAVEDALPGACAVELIHAYSLVHDDLPAMDDDDERRGKPTVHVAFDEATAILCGDALLTLAFECLSGKGEPAERVRPERLLPCVRELADCCGHAGLVGGQALDLAKQGDEVGSIAELEEIHLGKTAALFRASSSLGGYLAGAEPGDQEVLIRYGTDLGLAFQHADDVLDAEHLHLREASAARLSELLAAARAGAERFGERGAALRALADLVEKYAHSGDG